MVSDFVSFEQKAFLRRIPKEPNLRNACCWFDAAEPKSNAEDNEPRAPQLSTFLKGVVNIIVNNQSHYPSTFEHDFDRLRLLQRDFQTCLVKAACNQVFIENLHRLGHNRLPSPENRSALQSRLASLINTADSRSNLYSQASAVALEIVRECHSISDNQSLPSIDSIDDTERRLLRSWKSGSSAHQELESILKADFATLLDEEVDIIKSLEPVQILNHFKPPTLPIIAPSRPPRYQQSHLQELPWGRDEHLQNGLLCMAKRTAHIAILHWRVWLPILYEQPWRREADGQNRYGSPLRSHSEEPADENGPRTSTSWWTEEEAVEVLGPQVC